MSTAWNAFPLFDRLFDDVMTGITGTSVAAAGRTFDPAIDVRANEGEIVLHADVPGVKEEDLEVTLEHGVLTIKGQRRYPGTGKDKVWLGRSYGAFERAFTLPDTVDADQLSATLDGGVLTVRIAQLPKAKARRIAIGVSRSPTSARAEVAPPGKGEAPDAAQGA